MLNKIFFVIILITILVLTFNNGDANAQIEIDKSTTCKIYDAMKIDINEIKKIPNINKIDKITLGIWVAGLGGMPDKKFPSEEKKNEIKNTITLNFEVYFSKYMVGSFSLAKFNDYKDSKLAWEDAGLPNPPYINTLPSGEKITGCEIISSVKTGCIMNVYMFYENYLCIASFTNGGLSMQNELCYKNIDNSIRTIKKIIDNVKNTQN